MRVLSELHLAVLRTGIRQRSDLASGDPLLVTPMPFPEMLAANELVLLGLVAPQHHGESVFAITTERGKLELRLQEAARISKQGAR